MLSKVSSVVGKRRENTWKHYLRGLWWSGLRLQESLELTWSDTSKLNLDMTGEHPVLVIPGSLEKGNEDRLLPIAPEFAEMVLSIPEDQRNGHFFNPMSRREDQSKRLLRNRAGKIISTIGEKANVVVNVSEKGKIKYASAHDLRRAFGTRWSNRVMPAVLQQLMRHASIETTMKYYVSQSAQVTTKILYASMSKNEIGDLGATLGATSPNEPENAPAK